MYDIVTYCSKNRFDAFSIFARSWLETNAANIHVYCDHGYCNWWSRWAKIGINVYPCFSYCSSAEAGCARKAESLKIHVGQIPSQFVLLDVDCLVRRDIEHVFDKDFDIAITVDPRSRQVRRKCNISSGVIFVKNTLSTRDFVDEWVEKQSVARGPCKDQSTLVKAIKRSSCGVVELSEDLYNCYPHTNAPYDISDWIHRVKHPMDLDQTKSGHNHITHFAHSIWKKIDPGCIAGL